MTARHRLDPSDDDDRHLAFDCWMTFNENGDWWTCHIFRLAAKADGPNQAKMVLGGWGREVMMFNEWEKSDQGAFARKWGLADRFKDAVDQADFEKEARDENDALPD
jgi:hypothetical protein